MAEKELRKYSFAVKDGEGRVREGVVRAPSAEAVTQNFIDRGFTPLKEPEEISTAGLNMELSFGKKRVKQKDVSIFARKFSTMLDSGIPMHTILSMLASAEGQNPALSVVIKDLEVQLKSGSSLSNAMTAHPLVFSPLMISMVSSGEEGGFLDRAMRQIADSLERDVKLRGKIKSAMTYPVAVFILAILLCTAMLLFIVPIFDEMFSGLGSELPFLTKMLVVMSNFMKVAVIPLVVAVIIAIFWWNKNKYRRAIREVKDPLLLKIPIFGKLQRKIIMSRFTRNLSTLLENSVPILNALNIVGATTGSIVVEDAMVEVQKQLEQGSTLSEALRRHAIFPTEDVDMIAIGEESGDPVSMLTNIANMYDEEVERSTEALTSLMEPLMIVVLGGMVGTMVIALYMPIFNIADAVKNS